MVAAMFYEAWENEDSSEVRFSTVDSITEQMMGGIMQGMRAFAKRVGLVLGAGVLAAGLLLWAICDETDKEP